MKLFIALLVFFAIGCSSPAERETLSVVVEVPKPIIVPVEEDKAEVEAREVRESYRTIRELTEAAMNGDGYNPVDQYRLADVVMAYISLMPKMPEARVDYELVVKTLVEDNQELRGIGNFGNLLYRVINLYDEGERQYAPELFARLQKAYIKLLKRQGFNPDQRHREEDDNSRYGRWGNNHDSDPLRCGNLIPAIMDVYDIVSRLEPDSQVGKMWSMHYADLTLEPHYCEGSWSGYHNPETFDEAYKIYESLGFASDMKRVVRWAAGANVSKFAFDPDYHRNNTGVDHFLMQARPWLALLSEGERKKLLKEEALLAEEMKSYKSAHDLYEELGDRTNMARMAALIIK